MVPIAARKTVVGLGANLGDRLAALRRATELIAQLPGVQLVARSSVWETEPVGGPPQPKYFNAAVALSSGLDPLDLLAALLRIEAELGRVRSIPNAPRTLDLDLLWIEGLRLELPTLQVPHPRLHERAFALAPMLEVVPDASDPISGAFYKEIFAVLGADGIRQLRAPLDAWKA